MSQSRKNIKFGVIGCSRVARKYFFPVIQSSEFIKLGFVGSRSKEKAHEWASQNNCNFFGHYDEVLESDVDAVYISLPIGLHEEWVIKAAKAGKHILCEKSSTTSYQSAKKMVEICKKNGVRLLEGFAFRFHPQHTLILEYIKNHLLGRLSSFYGAYGFPPPDPTDIRWQKNLGGGVLNDVTCYPICASRIIFQSEPVSVMANLEVDKNYDVDIGNGIMLSYHDNRTAFAVSGFQNYYQSTYCVWGSKAMLSTKRAYAVTQNYETSVYFHKDDKINEIPIPAADQFKIMIESFAKTLLSIEVPHFNYEEDLLNQAKVLEAIRTSSKKKQLIFLDEIN